MPLVEIRLLPGAEVDVPAALAEVTRRVAAHLGEEPRGTWAVLERLAPGHFAEGADAPARQPAATHPALVRLYANRPAEDVGVLMRVVGEAVVAAFALAPGNVMVRYEAADPERLWWGA